jgi:hypothetical protein
VVRPLPAPRVQVPARRRLRTRAMELGPFPSRTV